MSNTIPPRTLFASASSTLFALTLQRTLRISSPNLSREGTLSASDTTWASASRVQHEEERGCGLIQSNTSISTFLPYYIPFLLSLPSSTLVHLCLSVHGLALPTTFTRLPSRRSIPFFCLSFF